MTGILSKNKSFAVPIMPAENNVSEDSERKFLRKILRTKLLSTLEERELARLAKNGDPKAKNRLIQANLRLVASIARKHSNNNISFLDLLQEGTLGLISAIDKYNYKLGYKFSTYASWWIKQAILKAVSEQSHGVKIPVYVQEIVSKYNKVKARMESNNPDGADIEEIAKKMNIPADKLENYISAFTKPSSLDDSFTYKDGNESRFIDMIADNNANVVKYAEFNDLKKDINAVIENLKKREQEVVKMRFGIDEINVKTLDEIGKLYGVTKECIRQTELRAIKKLKNLCNIEDFKDYNLN
jgi:RNA polymerase primary sigma factor